MAKICQKCGQQFKHRKSLYCSLECSGSRSQNKKHGHSETRVYESWRKMRRRCTQTNFIDYPRYGGRGIKMCERWNDFANFYADMGPRPEGCSLDRIDNNGNYEPGNCRWATKAEQNRNKRNTLCPADVDRIRLAPDMPVSKLAQEIGCSESSIYRVRSGKSYAPALTDQRPPLKQEDGK